MAYEFSETSEVRYLLEDLSHSYDELLTNGYIVPIGKNYLSCALTVREKESQEIELYKQKLKEFCLSAVLSSRQASPPNKSSNADVVGAGS